MDMSVFKNRFSHLGAVLQALLVTFLWSTSFVLVKIGLQDIPALTFAGLRYSLAFLCLLPFVLRPAGLISLRGLSGQRWARLIVLGLLFYAVTQGAQFLGLAYLPALTVSLLLNFTTIVVALLGIFLLAERPTALQWSGVFLNIVGIVIYFYPVAIPASQVVGLIVVTVGVLANAGSSILGRRVNRDGDISPLTVTIVSMGVGAIVLLGTGVLTQGLPPLSPVHWVIIGWLAVVNTAFAFTLWNHTLRTLSAMESSIINSTMLVQIAILAWLFLGEQLTWQEGIGMVLAGFGALIVQVRPQSGKPVADRVARKEFTEQA
jgi:drug/metabolite transporter (DMT)-like permease